MEILAFGIAGFSLLLVVLGCLDAVSARTQIALPLLAAIAGLIGGIGFLFADPAGRGWLLDSYDLWFIRSLGLTPQSVVTLLLPPLLFELTLGVDVRKLRQDTVIVGVMAVIAVVVVTGLVGLSLTLLAGLPILASLLLGATISTTDPAAVVAVFRRIGAPRRLLIVLEGESLLNDAAAIALFVLFIGMLRAEISPTLLGVIGDFGFLFAVGAVTGMALGWLTSRAMTFLRGNYLSQCSLSLAAAYGSYLVAEVAVGASGVVAVVVAGLTLTMSGASRVSSEDWQAVRTVWSQLGYWANGLIILIAAGLSPALLLQLQPADSLLVLLVVAAAFLARAAILYLLLPLLDRLGVSSPMTPKQRLLIWWGGIRGAVTLLLALSLAASPALPVELGTKLAAVGVAFVFVTLFVNGSSLAWVTRWLGLDRLSASDLALRNELVERTIHRGIDHLDELAQEHNLADASLESVRASLRARLSEFSADAPEAIPAFGDRLRTSLIIVANQERRIVRQHYDEGIVGRDTMRHLQRIAETLVDAAIVDGRDGYEEQAAQSVRYPDSFRVAVWLQRYLGIDWLISSMLARRFRLLFEWQIILQELLKFADWRIEELLGEDVAQNLHELIEERRQSVMDALQSLESQYPRYAESLRQGFVARAALRWERGRYDRFLREAIIGPDLHRNLLLHIDRQLAETYVPPKVDQGYDRKALTAIVPLFRQLDALDRKRIQRIVRVRSALPEEVIVAKGERGDAMYFIASGALEMSDGHNSQFLGTGDFFGELAILRPTRRRQTDVVAAGFCRLLVLRREDFKKLSAKSPKLREAIEESAKAIATA